MNLLTMTYSQFDVVVVPFPFTEIAASKRRPALVLSRRSTFNQTAGHSVMAMITTANRSSWPLDVRLQNLEPAGLNTASIVRMKLFSIDHQLIRKQIGTLSRTDQRKVQLSLRKMLWPTMAYSQRRRLLVSS